MCHFAFIWLKTLLLAALPIPALSGALHETGRLPASIPEASALVRSASAPDLFWTLNDSFNPPDLFVIDRTGRCYGQFRVAAENFDWEAMAIDPRGNLYVGDVGNNVVPGGLRVRKVYRLREPDLARIVDRSATRPVRQDLRVDATFYYTFPGKPFDAEALFVRDGNLYLISKGPAATTCLYQVDISTPGATRPLKEVCRLPQVGTVTDASLSGDGGRLAVCSYCYVAIFTLDLDEPIERLAGKVPTVYRFRPTSSEGCSWNGPDELLLAAEGGAMYSLGIGPSATQPAAQTGVRASTQRTTWH